MTPLLNVGALVAEVERDSRSADALARLTRASLAAAELTDMADAMLTHFVEAARQQQHSWSEISAALGVTKQAAHKRFSWSPQVPHLGLVLTDRARTAIRTAISEAEQLGHRAVGVEHLLLGLFEPADSIAARVLADCGAAPAPIRTSVADRRRSTESDVTDGSFTESALAVLGGADTQARRLGHNYVGTEHLLLAIVHCADEHVTHLLPPALHRPADVKRRVTAYLLPHR